MKSKIVVTCSCGKKWSDENTPEAAESWWKALDSVHPALVKHTEEKGYAKTVEWALRLLSAMHTTSCEQQGDKRKHEITITEEIVVESLEVLDKLEKQK
jgi:hypothetical protein